MEYNVQLAKGKWLWLKDMDLNNIYIWVNWSTQLWINLFSRWNAWMKLMCWETELDCFMGDSTQPFRWTNDDTVLLQLMVNIEPIVVWALLTNELILIIN